MIKFSNVSKRYGQLLALNNISFDMKEGRVIGLLGPNGSGKSTIIKIINGLLKADSGMIEVNGLDVGIKSKEIVSYLPERNYLDKNLKVDELIKFFKDFYPNFNEQKAYKLLKDLKIDSSKKVKTLSKGNIEKVQLILVMSRDAKYYILDEPIAGVDPATRDYIISTVLNNLSEGSTLIISTHLIYEIEELLDDLIIIKEGNIVYYGTKEQLVKEHNSIDEWFRKEFRHV